MAVHPRLVSSGFSSERHLVWLVFPLGSLGSPFDSTVVHCGYQSP